MKKYKHTPGPWEVIHPINPPLDQKYDLAIVANIKSLNKKKVIAECFGQVSTHEKQVPVEANATLIMAAPDLLKACKLLLKIGDQCWSHQSIMSKLFTVLNVTEKVIAKAEGE